MSDTVLEPVVTSITVACPVEHAFRVFTDDIARWWPLKTHSLAGEEATSVFFEPRRGGRIYESGPDGEQTWGTVRAWEPHRRLIYSWHPGRPPQAATEVEVTFEKSDGGTLVTVQHRDWHRLGPDAARVRTRYSQPDAWPGVLDLFKTRIEKEES